MSLVKRCCIAWLDLLLISNRHGSGGLDSVIALDCPHHDLAVDTAVSEGMMGQTWV